MGQNISSSPFDWILPPMQAYLDKPHIYAISIRSCDWNHPGKRGASLSIQILKMFHMLTDGQCLDRNDSLWPYCTTKSPLSLTSIQHLTFSYLLGSHKGFFFRTYPLLSQSAHCLSYHHPNTSTYIKQPPLQPPTNLFIRIGNPFLFFHLRHSFWRCPLFFFIAVISFSSSPQSCFPA